MRQNFPKIPAVLPALLIAAAIAAPAMAENMYPECPLRRSKPVNFRTTFSEDAMEISIGTGPCYKATVTLVIRDDQGGKILYLYAVPFGQLTAVPWDDAEMNEVAEEVVDSMISDPMQSTSSLPPYAEPGAYYEEYYDHIEVSREEYERLRTENRPMFQHPTYYEGWQYAIWDAATKSPKVIITGGL